MKKIHSIANKLKNGYVKRPDCMYIVHWLDVRIRCEIHSQFTRIYTLFDVIVAVIIVNIHSHSFTTRLHCFVHSQHNASHKIQIMENDGQKLLRMVFLKN